MTTEHISDIASILSSCNDVISAEVPKYLEGIAKIIKEAEFTEIFSQIEPSEGANWLNNNCHKAYELLIEFLNKHGHRNLGEVFSNEVCRYKYKKLQVRKCIKKLIDYQQMKMSIIDELLLLFL